MKTHELKTVQPYFERCWETSKTFEVRKNDRNFQTGDHILLKEYDQETDTYSGRELVCRIEYVLNEFPALEKGYVVFSFSIVQYIDRKPSLTITSVSIIHRNIL
jgi:hypothetical protein